MSPQSRARQIRDNRRWIHEQMLAWGRCREHVTAALGFPSSTTLGRWRDQQEGAAQAGQAPELTIPERCADRPNRILTIERLVRDMPMAWRAVVFAVYVQGRSMSGYAQATDQDKMRVMHRMHDAQDAVYQAIRSFETQDLRDARKREREERAAAA